MYAGIETVLAMPPSVCSSSLFFSLFLASLGGPNTPVLYIIVLPTQPAFVLPITIDRQRVRRGTRSYNDIMIFRSYRIKNGQVEYVEK